MVFAAISLNLSAQFANTKSSSFSSGDKSYEGWSGVTLSYNASSFVYSDGDDSESFPGFSFGYVRGVNIIKKLPMFVEFGGELQYRAKSESYDEIETKVNMLSVNIPVNLVYKHNFTEDFAIKPFFGLGFRGNIFGKYKYSYDFDGESNEESESIFENDGIKRFQMGWHIGCGVNYKMFNFALSYGKDFMEMSDDVKLSEVVIALGINF